MKAIVMYNSQTGFTAQYARWLAEAMGCEAVAFEKRKRADFSSCDTVLFGSWCHAGRMKKVKWLRRMLPEWRDKRVGVFLVGAMPEGAEAVQTTLQGLLPGRTEKNAAFYLPGGLRYEKMGVGDRIMMRLFVSMLSAKRDKTPEEEEAAGMLSGSYDLSNRRYIRPILNWLGLELD